jgi:hypothetical protein
MKNLIQQAAMFYDARDSAKVILGDQYADRMAILAHNIRHVMEKSGENEIIAGARFANQLAKSGRAVEAVYAMAAVVEMVEGPRPTQTVIGDDNG